MLARFVKVAIDGCAALLALFAAYCLVFSSSASDWLHLTFLSGGLFFPIYGLLGASATVLLKADRNAWRFTSLQECVSLLYAAAISAGGLLAWRFFQDRGDGLPRSVLFIATILDLGLMVGARLAVRLYRERNALNLLGESWTSGHSARDTLLVGSGASVDAYLRDPRRMADEQLGIIGAVICNAKKFSGAIRGVQTLGSAAEMFEIVDRLRERGQKIASILILDEALLHDGTISPEAFARARDNQIRLLRLPRISELGVEGAHDRLAPRTIEFEELLRRPSVALSPTAVIQMLDGARVLVTGAGGSIGSELCRQIAALGCAHLTCLDSCEFNLYSIDEELTRAAPALEHAAVLCDIRDRIALDIAIRTHAPDIVFHAAALKHVPLMEANPIAAAATNVLGTANVRAAAEVAGCRTFVLVSTDKSVAPSSVMGRTKRIAEAIVRATGATQTSTMQTVVVRFGNVLGSAGSVIPLFRAQLERGGPVTITHPDVERYFMTIPEAVTLITHAAALARDEQQRNPIFVLEMGTPIKIVDLACQVARAYNVELGQQVKLVFTGLRPGEKITEELIDEGEHASQSGLAGIRAVLSPYISRAQVETALDRIRTAVDRHDEIAVRRALTELVEHIRGGSTSTGVVLEISPRKSPTTVRP